MAPPKDDPRWFHAKKGHPETLYCNECGMRVNETLSEFICTGCGKRELSDERKPSVSKRVVVPTRKQELAAKKAQEEAQAREREKRQAMKLRELKEYAADHPDLIEAVHASALFEASNGNVAAQKLVYDRIFGAVPQPVKLDVTKLSDDELIARAKAALSGIDPEGFDSQPEGE